MEGRLKQFYKGEYQEMQAVQKGSGKLLFRVGVLLFKTVGPVRCLC